MAFGATPRCGRHAISGSLVRSIARIYPGSPEWKSRKHRGRVMGTEGQQESLGLENTDAAEGYGGECQEERPYGQTFTVIRSGAVWVSCTHKPAHEHRLA